MRKRPYLLLEVLVAFSILALCLPILLRQPFNFLHYQISSVEEAEIAHLERLRFAEIKTQLYLNKITLNTLTEAKNLQEAKEKPLISKKTIRVHGMVRQDEKKKKELESREFSEKVYFWKKTADVSNEGDHLFLIYIRLVYTPINQKGKGYKFDHRVFVKQTKKASVHTA
ncbi:MAG: hypothetical protein ACHQT8_00385 [Chlamydiales bacterium]